MPHNARPALLAFGLSVLPFLWSAGTELSPAWAEAGLRFLGPRFLGPYLALGYGAILLAMMSGALLGFALRHERGGRAAPLAVIPAAWAFLFVGGGPVGAAIWLAAGWLAALALDWMFWRNGLSPVWWWPLRLAQTVVVVLCLAVTAFL